MKNSQRALAIVFEGLLSILFIIISGGCVNGGSATSGYPIVVVATQDTKDLRPPLDVKLSRVRIRNAPIITALLQLSNSINSSPESHSHFSWYISDETPSRRDSSPTVSLDTANVTLRSVLDDLSAQAGWTYKGGVKGIYFSDRKGMRHDRTMIKSQHGRRGQVSDLTPCSLRAPG